MISIYLSEGNIRNGSELILFAAMRYGIRDAEIHVIFDSKRLDRLAPSGMCLDALLYNNPIPHSYNLLLRPNQPNEFDILCHEMAHLAQYERGDLSVDLSRNRFIWKGEEFSASVPYDSRPWEREAFEEQRRLKRDFDKSRSNK